MTTLDADVVVVGAGIVGLATARALSAEHGRKIVVVETEDRIGVHQTGHNSGVIHSGIYYRPGSLKARGCVEGRDAMYRYCAERGIAHEACGKIVVAVDDAERPALDELERRGIANGLQGLRRLAPEEILEREAHVAGVDGLLVPQTGIADYGAVSAAFADDVRGAGGEIRLGVRAGTATRDENDIVLETTSAPVRARMLVNCGGLHADRVALRCGADPPVRIVPFRGEYYELREERRHLINHLVYPVPNPALPFLGVHFTRRVDGSVEAGPNAVLAMKREGYRRFSFSPRDAASNAAWPGLWRLARRYWRTGAGEWWRSMSKRAFVNALKRLVPALTADDVVRAGAGVRAQAVDRDGNLVDDFRILELDRMVHVLNAPSPGATASLFIGSSIAETAARHLAK
ncbi:MAG: L-2-hydroxyglutarate oxidase [Planctomycetes bacterium]|nr:L-2-hydroxyglutarate oxidase [Planctomycetota bacterium]